MHTTATTNHHQADPQQQQNTATTSKVRPLKFQTLITIMYSLTVILIWTFTLSGSKAFATKKLPISETRSKTTALNVLPRILSAYPVVAESAAAGTMACLGDFLAQRKDTKRPYDPVRTAHFLFKGLGEGIMWAFWYRMVEQWSLSIAKAILASFRQFQMYEAALKISICILLDLLVACPIIYGLWDIPVPALLRGERNVMQQVRAKLLEMVFASVKVWLPVNVVVYNLPVEYRVYLSSTADVFWQSIVSSISSRPLLGDEPMPKAS